jgi:hypothetical protein
VREPVEYASAHLPGSLNLIVIYKVSHAARSVRRKSGVSRLASSSSPVAHTVAFLPSAGT